MVHPVEFVPLECIETRPVSKRDRGRFVSCGWRRDGANAAMKKSGTRRTSNGGAMVGLPGCVFRTAGQASRVGTRFKPSIDRKITFVLITLRVMSPSRRSERSTGGNSEVVFRSVPSSSYVISVGSGHAPRPRFNPQGKRRAPPFAPVKNLGRRPTLQASYQSHVMGCPAGVSRYTFRGTCCTNRRFAGRTARGRSPGSTQTTRMNTAFIPVYQRFPYSCFTVLSENVTEHLSTTVTHLLAQLLREKFADSCGEFLGEFPHSSRLPETRWLPDLPDLGADCKRRHVLRVVCDPSALIVNLPTDSIAGPSLYAPAGLAPAEHGIDN